MADQTHPIRHPEEFLDVLSAVSGDRRYQALAPLLQERREEDVTMCIIAEELENRGIRQGIQIGIEATARNMFKRNMTAEDAAAICEVSLAQAQAWFVKWQKESGQ